MPAKITPVCERSPYYTGINLWNDLNKSVQESHDIFTFKKEIGRLNRTYVKL